MALTELPGQLKIRWPTNTQIYSSCKSAKIQIQFFVCNFKFQVPSIFIVDVSAIGCNLLMTYSTTPAFHTSHRHDVNTNTDTNTNTNANTDTNTTINTNKFYTSHLPAMVGLHEINWKKFFGFISKFFGWHFLSHAKIFKGA